MAHTVISIRTYAIVYLLLMLLMAATIGAHYLHLGRMALAAAMAIAIIKAVLVVLYFMHVRYSSHLTWVVSVGAFCWLMILFGLTFNDYIARGWVGE
ncbi:MAG TPA: cytochrome C oxidase subunit IV family protein [Planctomycetota bacterium]|nr:cytochrome C oxidase subunit IV family protein [Planctomycetota bacterium]